MDKEEMTQFVIRELGKHRRRSDIVMDICEQTGMDWQAAQRFVYQVGYDARKSIAARQSPLAIIFGIAFIAGGLGMALIGIIATARGLSLHYQGIPYAGNIGGVFFGMNLIAGGVIGLWDTIKTWM